jgi:hypothetical protein
LVRLWKWQRHACRTSDDNTQNNQHDQKRDQA